MANTSYRNGKLFVPVDCGKVAFEEISLGESIVDLEKLSVDFAKESFIVNEVEPLVISDSKLEDFSDVNLQNETVNLRNFIAFKNRDKETSFSQRLINLLNTDVTTPICDVLNADVSIAFQGFGNKERPIPLQDVFDNLINMVSTNKEE